MRAQTGDAGYRSALEILHANDNIKRLCYDLLAAPFVMIVQEPMLLLTTLLMSYVYGLLYLLFQALPFIFQDIYHWNVSGRLPFERRKIEAHGMGRLEYWAWPFYHSLQVASLAVS